MPTKISSKVCYATVGNMSRSGTMITLKFLSAKADAETIFNTFTDGTNYQTVGTQAAGYERFTVNGWYQKDRSGVQIQEAYALITLVFDTQNVQGLNLTTPSGDRYDPTYDLSAGTEERPIEQHPSFKCFWAYNLYELVALGGSATTPLPAWASTDTNPNAIHAGYLWSRTPPSSPDAAHEYIQVQAATKPGRDTYLIPRPTVTSVIYYKVRAVQTSDLVAVGMLKAPAETYIYPNTQSCWLVTGCSVSDASDDLRAVTTTYQYAEEGWDTAIYPLYTPPS